MPVVPVARLHLRSSHRAVAQVHEPFEFSRFQISRPRWTSSPSSTASGGSATARRGFRARSRPEALRRRCFTGRSISGRVETLFSDGIALAFLLISGRSTPALPRRPSWTDSRALAMRRLSEWVESTWRVGLHCGSGRAGESFAHSLCAMFRRSFGRRLTNGCFRAGSIVPSNCSKARSRSRQSPPCPDLSTRATSPSIHAARRRNARQLAPAAALTKALTDPRSGAGGKRHSKT